MQPPIVKTIRRVLLVIILLVILAVIFNYLHALYRQNDASRTMPEMLGSEYMRSVESIEYFEHRNGVLRFRIKAHKLLETRDSRNLLDGIEAWDFNDEGVMRNSIRSDKAEYDRERKVVDFIGDVRLFIGNDVELQTPALRYDLNDNVATTSDSMRFLSGAMSGTARGINYDQDREMLKLESDVSFVFSPVRDDTDGRNETGRIHVTSRQGTAALLRNELIFEGGAMITAENQGTIHGERIEITLSPDHRRIDSLRAGGQAAYRFDDGTATRILSGDRMVFAIGDSGNLEKIAVSERAGLAAKSPAQEERLSADAIDVIFDAVTGSVAEVHGRTGVTLHMKRGNEETAASGEYLKADFIPGAGRLNNVHINDQALFSMTRRGNAPSMTLEADDIAAQFHERDGQASIGIIKAGGAVRWSLPNGPDRLETGGGVFSRSLSASVLEIIFSELEDSPESGKASGSVVITETLQSLRRSLEADAVHFRFFTKDSGIRDITAEGRVRIVQQEKDDSLQGPFTERFRTESDFLTAEFVPNENGSIVRSAAQWGNFRYRDDVRTASAGRLDYFAEKSLLALKGDPRIADKRSVTTGDYIEFDRKQNSLLVRGRVRSILEPQSGAGSFFHASDLSSPTVVTADELRYWTEIGKFRYSGGVQAVSEKQQLRAQRIDVYEHGERVEAEGGVRHLLFFSPSPSASSQMRPAPGAAVSPEPTIIQSDAMRYAQKNGELVYSGNVRLTAEEISLSSAELDVLSKPGGSAVTQAVARGKVVIRRDGFTSTGDTADWYPENGKLIVVGDPVEMNHPDRGRSYARRLTYFQADDRILLE